MEVEDGHSCLENNNSGTDVNSLVNTNRGTITSRSAKDGNSNLPVDDGSDGTSASGAVSGGSPAGLNKSSPSSCSQQYKHRREAPSPTGQGENYGVAKIKAVMKACKTDAERKPNLSYIALISLAIQSTPEQKILLGDIYQWLMDTFPYYKSKERSWRNSIRHNLSLNECFVKVGRGDSGKGKGNYWAVHPANIDDFQKGDFRRRHARRRVKHCNEDQEKHQLQLQLNEASILQAQEQQQKQQQFKPDHAGEIFDCRDAVPGTTGILTSSGYVPMTLTRAPASVLVEMFGARNILTRQEMLQLQFEDGTIPRSSQGKKSTSKKNISSSSNSNSNISRPIPTPMLDSDYKNVFGNLSVTDTEQAAVHLGELSDTWTNLSTTSPYLDVSYEEIIQSNGAYENLADNVIPTSEGNSSSCRFSSFGYPTHDLIGGAHQPQPANDVNTLCAPSSASTAATWNAAGLGFAAMPMAPGSTQDLLLEQLLSGTDRASQDHLGTGLELHYNSVQMTVTTSVSGKVQGMW